MTFWDEASLREIERRIVDAMREWLLKVMKEYYRLYPPSWKAGR